MPYAGWPRRVAEAGGRAFCAQANRLGIFGCRIVRFSEGAGFDFGLFGADQRPQNTHPLPNEQRMRHPQKDVPPARQCVGCDAACLVDATRVSFPLTNTFMEFSFSPASSVYSKESFETNFMMYRV
jgi:hypothetical protein